PAAQSSPCSSSLSLHDALPVFTELPSKARFSVRRAVASDAADVEALILLHVPSGALLPRSEGFIVENAADFLIALEGEKVVGCADRKSTRLNSSHVKISYAVCC